MLPEFFNASELERLIAEAESRITKEKNLGSLRIVGRQYQELCTKYTALKTGKQDVS